MSRNDIDSSETRYSSDVEKWILLQSSPTSHTTTTTTKSTGMSQEPPMEKTNNTPPDTDDEIVEFVEESEYEEVNDDFDFNSSEGSSEPIVTPALQREASRQSLMSTTSDAYSLPVGAQDDVSSLEHEDDDDDEDDDEDSSPAGETKIAESPEQELQGSATFSFLAASKRPSLTVTPEKPSHDTIGGPSPAKLQARREAYINSKQRGSALQLSHSNLGDIPLVEGDNETHADDDTNTIEEKSKDAASLDLDDLGSDGTEEKPSKEVDQLTLRLHQSLFIPFSESDLMTPTAGGPNRSNSAQEFQRPNSLDMEDADEILARNLPPELDLNEARKYIAQLAHGVPEKPLFTTPHRSSSTPNATSRGHLTGSSFHRRNMLHSAGRSSAMSSEYTEIVVEDDQDPSLRRTLGFSPALRTPLSNSRYFTTTPSSHIASASGHFSEYTEIVIEDESESSPMASSNHRKMYSNRESSLSHDFSELVEWEEEEVIEEIIDESFH